ncbi:MAG: SMC-Scp complex subunit ScpB [Phycisphaerae bacterium]|jgi:segregation and condensation protein B
MTERREAPGAEGVAVEAVEAPRVEAEAWPSGSDQAAVGAPSEDAEPQGSTGSAIRLAPTGDDADGPMDHVEPLGDATPSDAETLVAAGAAAEITTEQIVEAILFGADVPLTPGKIAGILGVGSVRDVRRHVEALNERYRQTGAAFRIENIAGGYQMLTLPEFNPWLKRLKQTRQDSKLSQAALETLAVVAYKQPVVRAQIEAIRGVAAGEMLNRLRELGLVKIVGRAEDVGRPLLYGTTKRFLDVFGLGSLEDLPAVEELKAPE